MCVSLYLSLSLSLSVAPSLCLSRSLSLSVLQSLFLSPLSLSRYHSFYLIYSIYLPTYRSINQSIYLSPSLPPFDWCCVCCCCFLLTPSHFNFCLFSTFIISPPSLSSISIVIHNLSVFTLFSLLLYPFLQDHSNLSILCLATLFTPFLSFSLISFPFLSLPLLRFSSLSFSLIYPPSRSLSRILSLSISLCCSFPLNKNTCVYIYIYTFFTHVSIFLCPCAFLSIDLFPLDRDKEPPEHPPVFFPESCASNLRGIEHGSPPHPQMKCSEKICSNMINFRFFFSDRKRVGLIGPPHVLETNRRLVRILKTQSLFGILVSTLFFQNLLLAAIQCIFQNTLNHFGGPILGQILLKNFRVFREIPSKKKASLPQEATLWWFQKGSPHIWTKEFSRKMTCLFLLVPPFLYSLSLSLYFSFSCFFLCFLFQVSISCFLLSILYILRSLLSLYHIYMYIYIEMYIYIFLSLSAFQSLFLSHSLYLLSNPSLFSPVSLHFLCSIFWVFFTHTHTLPLSLFFFSARLFLLILLYNLYYFYSHHSLDFLIICSSTLLTLLALPLPNCHLSVSRVFSTLSLSLSPSLSHFVSVSLNLS